MSPIELFDTVLKTGAGVLLLVEDLNDPEKESKRLNVCKSNSCYNKKRDKCKHCTCYMSVKVTMLKNINPHKGGRVEITHCPLAKWGEDGELEIVNHYRKIDGLPLLSN